MIPYDKIELGIPYHCRCKRNGKHCIVAVYGRKWQGGIAIDQTKGTDPNCFRQDADDYEFIAPVLPPADVMDVLSTRRIEEVA